MQIHTNGRDFIAGGVVFHADKSGHVEIPDHIAQAEGLQKHEEEGPKGIPSSALRDKASLCAWAKEHVGLDLDPESGTKDELRALIEEAMKEQE